MKQESLGALPTEELVARFAANSIEQDKAELKRQSSRVSRLVQAMWRIQDELKSRSGDERHALVALLDHPNLEVRLNAAKAVASIAPVAARQSLEIIAASRRYPQAAEAGMTINALDAGTWAPDRSAT